jgi:hypothetical protein
MAHAAPIPRIGSVDNGEFGKQRASDCTLSAIKSPSMTMALLVQHEQDGA